MGSGSSRNVKPLDGPDAKAAASASEPSKDGDRVQWIGGPATGTVTADSASGTEAGADVLVVKEFDRPSSSSSNTKRPRSSNAKGPTLVKEVKTSHEDDTSTITTKTAEIEKERDNLKIENERLEKQMGELESHNLDLVERIQVLEEQLEKVHVDKLANATVPCVNTVAAKDQYIAKLEKETQSVQEEIAKLKSKYKKKFRQMNSQMSEAKHESSLHVFEMKDELQRLKQENEKLLEQVNTSGITGGHNSVQNRPTTPGGDRTGLILDLSAQVSSQENKIIELEQKLQERDKMIEDLKSTQKQRSGSGKGNRSGSAKSQSSLFSKGEQENDDWSVDGHSIMTATPEHGDTSMPPSGTTKHSPDLAEMKALAREMQQVQRKITKKKSILKNRIKIPITKGTISGAPDSRESSGTSRDSGVVLPDSEANCSKTQSNWMTSRNRTGTFDLQADMGDDLELQSFSATPSLPRTFQTASPESVISKWSDEETGPEKGAVKSAVSLSSIRRISAPKKKKKHALSDQDLIVDSLLKDLDEPIKQNPLSKIEGSSEVDYFSALSHPVSVTGQ